MDARRALTLLDGSGMSLEDAARRALHGRRATRRITVQEAVDEFVRSRLAKGRRARTVEWYEVKLANLTAAFGDRRIDDVDRPQLLQWLNSLDVSKGTRAGIARACRVLWIWATAQEPAIVTIDATVGFETTGPSNQGEAAFLTVPETAAVLAAAGPYRSAAALLLFAGLRPEEVAGRAKPMLLWRHVRVEERIIRIPADVAKTGKPRIIEGLPETLWPWLQPSANDAQPVAPGRIRQLLDRVKVAIKPRRWPHDATRHTFATYALASTNDPGRVAMWLGHEGNPTMLHRHYRGLATKAEADKFFALRPPA